MKKLLLPLLALSMLLNANSAKGWGAKGHDIIAYIAECNVSPKVRKAVTKVLEGRSMMYYSSWMDNIRDIPEYRVTSTWHYANVDEGETYETMKKEAKGDVYTAVMMVTEKLMDRKNLCDSTETLYVKLLVHMVGDMHCPMHAGRLSDRGGNNLKIKWFNSSTNIHSVWDSAFIESSRKWSYVEWRNNIDYLTKKQKREIMLGTPMEWFTETVEMARQIYMEVEPGKNYSWAYMYNNFPLLEQQLRNGGYRLAALLNRIYG